MTERGEGCGREQGNERDRERVGVRHGVRCKEVESGEEGSRGECFVVIWGSRKGGREERAMEGGV